MRLACWSFSWHKKNKLSFEVEEIKTTLVKFAGATKLGGGVQQPCSRAGLPFGAKENHQQEPLQPMWYGVRVQDRGRESRVCF